MITSTIGKIFLDAYNEKYKCSYDARTFFDEVYFPLFFNSNKYMQWVQNSPFVQMKGGQKVDRLTEAERLEKLDIFHDKIGAGAVDASVAIGYAASELKEFATTSGQVTNISFDVSEDSIYYSWIGSGLGIGLQGGMSLLFSDKEILLDLFEGWGIYRKLLDTNDDLKGNQIGTWNGQWLAHRYDDEYNESNPMQNFDPYETKADVLSIKTQSWTKVLIGIAMKYKYVQLTGYVYSFGQTNTTVGFIPFVLPEIKRPVQLYKKLFGLKNAKEAEQMWGTEKGLRLCCQAGVIGLKAMAPKGVIKFIGDRTVPKIKKDNEKQQITYNTYITWILAMLKNDELWDVAQDFAQVLHDYVSKYEKKLSTKRSNDVDKVLGSVNKKTFIEALTEIVKSAEDKESITNLAKEVNMMPADNVPYFLTLIRFNYASIN